VPGYGVSRDTPHRLYLRELNDSDDWVDIRARRTLEQLGQIELVTRNPQSTNTDAAAVVFRLLIVAWSLKRGDDDPEPMPLTEAVFRAELDEATATWLTQQMVAYYNQRMLTPEASKNSSGHSLVP
jgi:hypothetical protein